MVTGGGRRSRRRKFSREVNSYSPTIAFVKKSVNASLIWFYFFFLCAGKCLLGISGVTSGGQLAAEDG